MHTGASYRWSFPENHSSKIKKKLGKNGPNSNFWVKIRILTFSGKVYNRFAPVRILGQVIDEVFRKIIFQKLKKKSGINSPNSNFRVKIRILTFSGKVYYRLAPVWCDRRNNNNSSSSHSLQSRKKGLNLLFYMILCYFSSSRK